MTQGYSSCQSFNSSEPNEGYSQPVLLQWWTWGTEGGQNTGLCLSLLFCSGIVAQWLDHQETVFPLSTCGLGLSSFSVEGDGVRFWYPLKKRCIFSGPFSFPASLNADIPMSTRDSNVTSQGKPCVSKDYTDAAKSCTFTWGSHIRKK